MPFSPDEIENKEFLITLRGYDKDEVNAFLRAVAADYRAALKDSSASVSLPAGDNPFEALGEEVGSVLRNARESAERTRRKAEEDAADYRRRAEEEARAMREAASNAARRLTEEAEQHAVEVRAAAEREATERLQETARRVERLQVTETKLRQRLYSLEVTLQNMRQELEAAEVTGEAPGARDDEHGDEGTREVGPSVGESGGGFSDLGLDLDDHEGTRAGSEPSS